MLFGEKKKSAKRPLERRKRNRRDKSRKLPKLRLRLRAGPPLRRSLMRRLIGLSNNKKKLNRRFQNKHLPLLLIRRKRKMRTVDLHLLEMEAELRIMSGHKL